jgi:pyruvate-formate lyase
LAKGITASINAYGSLPNHLVSGGASTMWDMDPTWVSPSLLHSIVGAFVQQGGQIFQGNMTSVEDLRRAFDDPDAYPNLIVRVGGFSARFVHLDRSLQLEIVERYRHAG